MTATSPRAFLLSATLHGAVVALLFLFSLAAGRLNNDEPKIIELVMGEGDNYGARVAAALGTPEGIKVSVPEPAVPEPTPQPAKLEPAPIVPAPPPTPKPAVKEAPPKDFAKAIQSEVRNAKRKAERQIAKERAAEEKRQAEEKKRMSKEQFDEKNRKVASAAPPKTGAPKVRPVDSEGIAKGVLGGSTDNKVGGQGGKALRTDNANEMDAFFAMFRDRVRKNFDAPPGLSDSLEAKVAVLSNANGTFSGARIVKSSGSREFDDAVVAAVKRVQMNPRPDKKSSSIEFTFAMSDREVR